MPLDVAECSRHAGPPCEGAEVRLARVVDDEQEHRRDTDHEPRQHVERDHAEQGRHAEYELGPLLPVVEPELGDLEQVRDGVDDQRREHRLRQVFEERRQQQHGDEDQRRGDERRDLRARTAPSLTADCERLPPPASPPISPEPTFATPSAISSWFGSIS